MSAGHQDKGKKSFEFRMSKKVAELTQVVHMLFTRNHEKEVEIDALKKSYEHEIDLVLQEARERIQRLEANLSNLTALNLEESEKARQRLELELSAQASEWLQKVRELENQLQEEKGECQNLRDLLINAQRDIENLRQGVTDQLSFKTDEISKKEKEAERLRGQVTALETELKDSQRDAQTVISEIQRTSERLEAEVRQLHQAMENSHKTRDQLLARNKQLEADMKALRRELNKRVSESRGGGGTRPQPSAEVNEELERLRREVQRYRLELSNRDNNFNRMFTEKQPVLVNQRQGLSSQKQPQIQQSGPPIYAFSQGNNQSSKTGIANGFANGLSSDVALNELAATQNGSLNPLSTPNTSFLKTRDQTNKFNFTDQTESLLGQLERQQTFPERSSIQDRLLTSGQDRHNQSRPRTQGQPMYLGQKMKQERLFSFDRQSSRQTSSALYTEEPSQILPQNPADRPFSSSLPSICSTPDQRRLSAQQANKPVPVQLTKPRPLPREVLYGK